jgi:hypothetical protein
MDFTEIELKAVNWADGCWTRTSGGLLAFDKMFLIS